ncbi:MAG: epoxyqueuosine reductase QueH, partial [Actinomycetia bacterium]|nr:epoxyqueuosine reductase QueH [Actinomycetes bacterium]
MLLHACCANCAAYPLSLLGDDFDITLFYYNPNIYP